MCTSQRACRMSWLVRLASKSPADGPSVGEPMMIMRALRPVAKSAIRYPLEP